MKRLNPGRRYRRVDGGAERDRTADLDIANVALSQLSYGPASTNEDQSEGARTAPALKIGRENDWKGSRSQGNQTHGRLSVFSPSTTSTLTCAGKKPPVG